ncbi:Hsp70 family protein [Janthinobacterium sp. BJB401]|uniref:Hsp70 family protein n=1 Tax=Janthinobacterium sp. BJB401 TaxID=2745934 RepID=UPI0015959A06|nr:Hsp70 family protein [Janthinobacterium sp. BJB401]NVI81760.1 hsp70 family protein [Janthinobacterium sp. BJB401]
MRGAKVQPAFLVGIDLGTTNTVVAYAKANDAQAEINLFAIEQLVAPGEVGARPLLPSLRYHPAAGELATGDLQLPWPQQDLEYAVLGALARQLGAQVPGRLVSSAKSWLSHANVDRQAPILPWGADADVAKVSPVAASASYLAYVRAAWHHRFPDSPLEEQELVLTIPASFDEGARALTLEAARMAGLPTVRLVEEPQAAFYDYLQRRRATLRTDLADTRRILVCDVGGGTTDFSLIDVTFDDDGEPQLTRSSVGNHLILGGDNMDLALAHLVETRMAAGSEGGMKLSAARLSQLMERCRAAKELLLSSDAPDKATVTLLGAGSRLIGGSRSADVTREEVAAMVVDGFFPKVELNDVAKKGRAGIVEFGLPYAQDAAITRHLASFLQQHQGALPDTLLLNGGVFRADALARRLAETLAHWRGAPLTILHNDNPDVAVARGAVAYALARSGQTPRIGGGSPRSYFLVLGEAGKDKRAVCILPRGSASGEEIRLTERLFALRLGRPVRFHLATSLFEAGTPPKLGEIVDLDAGEYLRLPPLASVLQAESGDKRDITVQLATVMTEVGTLEVHCVAEADANQRWLLEFQLRGEEDVASETSSVSPRVKEAIEKIERIFGGKAQKVEAKEVRQLRQHLERGLGGRESWETPLLRQLFDALLQRARGRRRSAEHERVWLNLAGYCLRPGYGDALDPWRIEQLWALFDAGVQHHKDNQVCAEWWTLWRRVAGGLSTEQQLRLLDDFAFNLQADAAQRGSRPVTLVNGSDDDMLRLGASLERVPGAYKAEVGAWLIKRLQKADKKGEAADTNTLWALARVGARQPFHGSAHEVVDSATVADWLHVLLALDWKKTEPAAFAATHLARMTGDRSRDIVDELRANILARLKAVGAPPLWQAMVSEVTQLDEAVTRRILGEALPPGLKLIG